MKNLLIAVLLLQSCGKSSDELPILGERDVIVRSIGGKQVSDTIYHRIPSFKFLDQNHKTVTNKDLAGKIYVADFFFTTCPGICPVMEKQMLRVYKKFKADDRLKILSHTIDPEHDTPERLGAYAQDLGVTDDQWLFLTGVKEDIYRIAQQGYLSVAAEDSAAEGGFIHKGYFVLVDSDRRIRGMYDGTTEDDVDRLISDIKLLLNTIQQRTGNKRPIR
ncbi:SCO family protein [Dyadobacter linearis]|uniref:SCO family protein n=1 Tax=Dyadobacter linearis TaxID=2823330 RepID=UPI001BFC1BB5|nr:SCO family protein [Dyadobacter sp. CECT 9623]